MTVHPWPHGCQTTAVKTGEQMSFSRAHLTANMTGSSYCQSQAQKHLHVGSSITTGVTSACMPVHQPLHEVLLYHVPLAAWAAVNNHIGHGFLAR